MRKNRNWIGFILAAAVLLGGCGYKDVWENRIDVKKSGQIRAVYVEDFSDATYNFEYFEAEVADAVDIYNKDADEKRITVKNVELEGDAARVILYYAAAEDAAKFNRMTFYNGPVPGAGEYASAATKLTSPDGEKKTTLRQAADEESTAFALVLAENTSLSVPGTVLYLSPNAVQGEDGRILVTADRTDDTLPETAVIIYRT